MKSMDKYSPKILLVAYDISMSSHHKFEDITGYVFLNKYIEVPIIFVLF